MNCLRSSIHEYLACHLDIRGVSSSFKQHGSSQIFALPHSSKISTQSSAAVPRSTLAISVYSQHEICADFQGQKIG